MRTATVEVDVDIDDVLDAMSDKDIVAEFDSRGLSRKDEPDARAIVTRAINMIRTGRVIDGVTELEREFFPAWKDKANCEEAYRTAMALKAAHGVAT